MCYTVYIHITPNNKKYIGITGRKPEYRWNNGNGYKNNEHFYRAILRYGWDNIEHKIIANNMSKEDACKLEQELIKKYNTTDFNNGYNNSIGGECGTFGTKLSEETRKKISLGHKGKHYKKRRNHTPEEKEKISKKLKGRVSPMKDKHWSDEQRAKVGTKILCVETGEIFISSREVERKTGLPHYYILKCCKEKHRTCGDYHWEYANDR